MKIKSKIFLGILVFLLVFAIGANLKTQAGSGENGRGWLWGGSETNPADNSSGTICDVNGDGVADKCQNGTIDGNEAGVGWISFNSLDFVGSPVSYGVNIPEGNGELSGHAWSENLGWISFNRADLAGCPTGACSARRTGNNLKGWARFMSIKKEAERGNSGGWQGWILLDGVSIDSANNTLSGYAWNGEFMMGASISGLGWIDFSGIKIEAVPRLIVCPSILLIAKGATEQLNAYHEKSIGVLSCAEKSSYSDVTDSSNWSVAAGPSFASVNNNSKKGEVEGEAAGSATVVAQYTPPGGVMLQAESQVVVTCVPDCSCSATTPIGEKCSDPNCGTECDGNRIPGGDWHEVTP